MSINTESISIKILIVLQKLRGLFDNSFALVVKGIWLVINYISVLGKLMWVKVKTLRPVLKHCRQDKNNFRLLINAYGSELKSSGRLVNA